MQNIRKLSNYSMGGQPPIPPGIYRFIGYPMGRCKKGRAAVLCPSVHPPAAALGLCFPALPYPPGRWQNNSTGSDIGNCYIESTTDHGCRIDEIQRYLNDPEIVKNGNSKIN